LLSCLEERRSPRTRLLCCRAGKRDEQDDRSQDETKGRASNLTMT
jgi:hypothetical protein